MHSMLAFIDALFPGGADHRDDEHHAPADDRIDLHDGRRVRVEPAHAADADAERAFVDALSATSRYRRFHFGLRELTPEASRAMVDVDQCRHVALVARADATTGDATAGDAKSGDTTSGDAMADDETAAPAIVADARYVVQADSGDAEFAIAVADAWQGVGLGRALLQRLTTQARAQGVRRLYGDVLWGNPAMLAVVRSLGATVMRNPGDATTVRVEFDFTGPA